MSSKSEEHLFSVEELKLFEKCQLLGIHNLNREVDAALANGDWMKVKVFSVLLIKKYNALYESSSEKVEAQVQQRTKAVEKAKAVVASFDVDVQKTLKGNQVLHYKGELSPADLAAVFNDAHAYSDKGLAVQVNLNTFVSLVTEEWFLKDFVAEMSLDTLIQGSPGKYLGVPLIYLANTQYYLADGLHFYPLEVR
jgi:hypothetical protein